MRLSSRVLLAEHSPLRSAYYVRASMALRNHTSADEISGNPGQQTKSGPRVLFGYAVCRALGRVCRAAQGGRGSHNQLLQLFDVG